MTHDNDPSSYGNLAVLEDDPSPGEVTVVGSGISETKRVSWSVADGRNRLDAMLPPWVENREMIVSLFTPAFERSFCCPGRQSEQCCQANDGDACFPKWREREDPEWYACAISTLLTQVNGRVLEQGTLVPALAANEAFELGCLFTEALIKFRWDKHAKRGLSTLNSAKSGGKAKKSANLARRSAAGTVQAVDALVSTGSSLTSAYRKVAKQQFVTEQTIAKEYRVAKKQR